MMTYSQKTVHAVQSREDTEHSRIWFEVMMQGLRDILSGKAEAREWLYSDDFEACCILAGAINQKRIRQMLERALQTDDKCRHK